MSNGIRIDFTEEEINRMSVEEKSTVTVRLIMGLYKIINGDRENEGLSRQVSRHEEWLRTIWKFIWVLIPALILSALGVILAGTK